MAEGGRGVVGRGCRRGVGGKERDRGKRRGGDREPWGEGKELGGSCW